VEVITRPNTELAIELVARLLEDRIRAQPKIVLGLATGRTMEHIYERLAGSDVSFKLISALHGQTFFFQA